MTLTNLPEGYAAGKSVAMHPKDKEGKFGNKVLHCARVVYVEAADVEGVQVGDRVTLSRWGNVKVTKVAGGFEGTFDPNDKDYKTTVRKMCWVGKTRHLVRAELVEFDYLINKKKLEEEDSICKGSPVLNQTTRVAWEALCCPNLRNVQQGTTLQVERRGYFIVDRPHADKRGLSMFMVPDGKKKACSALTSKLAHR